MRPSTGLGSVRCPCGWHGTRALSTTQPCPSCGSPVDYGPARAKQREARLRNEAKAKRDNDEARASMAAHNEAERTREREESERITAQLRAAREAAQR